ncbi:hypothetical protein CSUB01_12328 [Colletotrichum sublineola]|uniref:Myb-like domain-containing protein n=1 Tax=Colletotrichum sublineola TaxID=1173701 RepID=A0A066X172_COLSU|nr:hypothetical protein CSUB01_12328 [Colletotrichum sublineola]
MGVTLDNIRFYKPPTPVVPQRAPKETGQRRSSTNPSIIGDVDIQPAMGSYTHHGAASLSFEPSGLALEDHMERVNDMLPPGGSTSSSIVGDFILETTPSVPVKEPTASGTPSENGTARTSATGSLIKSPFPTASRPFTLTEGLTDSLQLEANMAGPQPTGGRAESTPDTTPEMHNRDATSPFKQEQQLGNLRDEDGPDVTAKPHSSSRMSSPAPQWVLGCQDAICISSTAPPSPGPPSPGPPSPGPPSPGPPCSGPSTSALRRSRRVQVPAGGYAEVDSDGESNADEGVNMSSYDRPCARSSLLGSPGPLGNKRRKRCFHEEPARENSRSKRFCGSQDTSTHKSKTRRSRRIATDMEAIGVVNPQQWESASGEEQSADYDVHATFDEFPLPSTPLRNFVLQRTIVGHVITYTLQWEQVKPCNRYQSAPEVLQSSRPSSPKPDVTPLPTRHRQAFSKDEDQLLQNLREKDYSWKEIHSQFSEKFPGRTQGALQVRYSTKLNR